MKILYKLTTRSRPDKMFTCLNNMMANSTESPKIIVTLDKNDSTVTDQLLEQLRNNYPDVTPIIGASVNKINAFNRDIPKEGWDIIAATSDDVMFQPGFDTQIKKDVLNAYLIQNGLPPMKAGAITVDMSKLDSVIWYDDGAVHGKILTVPVMTRVYYERLGYIYNPIYGNFFPDEEAIYVGEKLGKIYYSEAKILDHMHPAWGKGEWDAQYKKANGTYESEKKIFNKRKAQRFPLWDCVNQTHI